MINTSQPRWYHYLMPSFLLQLLVILTCLIIFLIQGIVYSIIEKDVTVFHGNCSLENVSDEHGDLTANLVAQCGEHTYSLNASQERLVYFHQLTIGEQPIIVCKKSVGQYLQGVKWSCLIGPENKEVEKI